MKKRILSLILALALAFSLLVFPASAAEIVDSGTCGADGDNVTWTLDSDGVLTISGEGEMKYYSVGAPWNESGTQIVIAEIEPGVTTIGGHAFSDCFNLTSVEIPDSITSIGLNAFDGCSSLTSVVIPDSVTSIGGQAFAYCSSLTSLEIPESVTDLGDWTFVGCSSLTSLEIPESVTGIGAHTFDGCSSLTSVVIPNSIISIDGSAFYGCYRLTDIYYGGTEEQWNAIDVGDYNDPLTYATIHYAPAVVDSGTCGENVNWVLTEDGVMTISGTGAMDDYSTVTDRPWHKLRASITSVVVEEGVTYIGKNAFQTCTKLESLTTASSVKTIGDYAFSGCSKLESLELAVGLRYLNSYAFQSCTALKEVSLPEGVTDIGYAAFSGCSSMTSVNIPEGVTSVEYYAFQNCSSLENVVIPDSVNSIEYAAFQNCSSMTSVNIPDSVTSIYSYTFQNCSSLTSVVIPDGITSIGGYAFQNCSSLTDLVIPDSVTSIECYAFSGCSSLTGVVIPDSVTSIEYSAFSNCSSLTSVVIPDSVVSIEDYAFQNCSSLTSVTIPDSVVSIGDWAFAYCDSLTDVYYSGNSAQWAAISIGDVNEPLTNAAIHFGASNPGKIESDPADVTAPVGGTASFTVVASGDVVSYQWQVSENGTDWANCEGAAATLELTAAESMDGYQYRCVVTDVNGDSVISNPATLTVAQPVVITASPSDSSTMAGRVTVFGVMAQGEGLSYHWQYKKPGGGWKNCSAVTQGFNTQFLMVQGVTGSTNRNGYQYRCVVTDAYGNTAASDAALLTVFAIKTQPKAATATADGSAVFSVVATGSDVQYQWQYKKPGGAWKNCSAVTQGYNTATLTVQGVTGKTNRNGYQYRCVITSGSMSLTSKAVKLTVN